MRRTAARRGVEGIVRVQLVPDARCARRRAVPSVLLGIVHKVHPLTAATTITTSATTTTTSATTSTSVSATVATSTVAAVQRAVADVLVRPRRCSQVPRGGRRAQAKGVCGDDVAKRLLSHLGPADSRQAALLVLATRLDGAVAQGASPAAVVPERARPLEIEACVAKERAIEQREEPWRNEITVQLLHCLDGAWAELRHATILTEERRTLRRDRDARSPGVMWAGRGDGAG